MAIRNTMVAEKAVANSAQTSAMPRSRLLVVSDKVSQTVRGRKMFCMCSDPRMPQRTIGRSSSFFDECL